MSHNNYSNRTRAFVALVAVMLLAFGSIAVSLVVCASASQYLDSVTRRELRIQSQLSLNACLDHGILMLSRDFFLSGVVDVDDFNCSLTISDVGINELHISATVHVGSIYIGVNSYGEESVLMSDREIQRISVSQ